MDNNYDKWDELFGEGSSSDDNAEKNDSSNSEFNVNSKDLDWLFDTNSEKLEDYSTNPTFGKMPEVDNTEIFNKIEEPTDKLMESDNMDQTNIVPSKKVKKLRKNPEKDMDKTPANDTFEDDFEEDDEDFRQTKIVSRGRQKRTGCLGGILYFVFVVGISVLLAAFGWMCASDVLAFGRDSLAVEVTIPEDADLDTIAETLKDAGLIKYKWLFKVYGGFSNAEDKVESGTYELNTKYDYRALVASMQHGSASQKVLEVMIPEGYTMRQIFNLLEKEGVCSADDLWYAATNIDFEYDFLEGKALGDPKRLEGYLFPDTYNFYAGDDAENVIKKLLNNATVKYNDDLIARAEARGYTLDEIIIVASIIEEEVGRAEERADAASVIYNRLNIDMPLQLDSTVIYIIDGTDEEFSTTIDDPYNTYVYTGLPVGPISNPGMAAIEAALNPNSTNYYYFASAKDGSTRFFTNYDAFDVFVNSDEYGIG